MCVLIVLCGVDPSWPLIVASNRDEHRARKGAPPGLFVGERHRMLSPRDRREGGTWLAIDALGRVAGLTNWRAAGPAPPGAPSRGHLPHAALDEDSLDAAIHRVHAMCHDRPPGGFQLAVADGERCLVTTFDGESFDTVTFDAPAAVVLTDEHRPASLVLPGLDAACAADLDLEQRFERLRGLLLDTGARSGHALLKVGDGDYGTVSSSLLALRPGHPRELVWRFAPGPPHEVEYRNYGNLARRLVEV